ncbi:MAG: FMN-binding protein [Nocardioidaceae bacterium]
MRRIVLWFMSTVTMVVLLFGYHTSTAGAMKATSSAVAPIDASSGTSGTSGSSGSSGSSNSSGSGSGSSGSGSSGSDSSGQSGTFTGDLTQTQWGPIQVEITVENGKITDVGVPTYPASNGRDLEINSYALPILVQETVDAQNAQIDMVSGATVTSVGYLQSLQSALDQAGL